MFTFRPWVGLGMLLVCTGGVGCRSVGHGLAGAASAVNLAAATVDLVSSVHALATVDEQSPELAPVAQPVETEPTSWAAENVPLVVAVGNHGQRRATSTTLGQLLPGLAETDVVWLGLRLDDPQHVARAAAVLDALADGGVARVVFATAPRTAEAEAVAARDAMLAPLWNVVAQHRLRASAASATGPHEDLARRVQMWLPAPLPGPVVVIADLQRVRTDVGAPAVLGAPAGRGHAPSQFVLAMQDAAPQQLGLTAQAPALVSYDAVWY